MANYGAMQRIIRVSQKTGGETDKKQVKNWGEDNIIGVKNVIGKGSHKSGEDHM